MTLTPTANAHCAAELLVGAAARGLGDHRQQVAGLAVGGELISQQAALLSTGYP